MGESGSTSSDGLQMGVAVFCLVVSLMTAMMVPVLAPDYSEGSYADLYAERQELEAFTGESMLSQTPFELAGVYTPYVEGEEATIENGWVNGGSISPYQPEGADKDLIGETTGIRLDPTQKSTVLFSQTVLEPEIRENKWYYGDNILGDFWWTVAGGIMDFVTGHSERTEVVQQQINTWTYTGYRYEFHSQLAMTSENENKDASDVALSIIWYDVAGQEGISGGLVVYDDINDAIVANYSAYDIIAGYATSSNFASSYTLDFQDWKIKMYIQFDPEVIQNAGDLGEAWSNGDWSLAFSAPSVDGLLNIDSSNSASMSIGSIISTYFDIFTFDLPNMPDTWGLVLWILCFVPMIIVTMLFMLRVVAAVIPF